MKILQVNPLFSPAHGGSAVAPYLLSKELAKKGHDITIFTTDYELSEEWVKSTQSLQIKVLPFKTWFNWARFQVTPGIIKSTKDGGNYFDIIHMHNYRTFQNIIVHHYAKKHDIPYVLQAHGSLVTFFQKGMLKRIFDTIWGYRILKDASKVIAVTKTEAEQYKSMGVKEDKIEIIPNAIDLSEFENLPERGEFRRQYGLDNNQKLILYLGRIHQIKGLDLLAEAFARLSKELKHARLVIVGPDDGYLCSLSKLISELRIKEEVVFTGPLYGRDKLEAYVDADVYVLPSSYEIFGITVLEACACATPVVVPSSCGLANWVEGYQAGYVIPHDKNQLQQALATILTDEKLSQQLASQARKLVEEQFAWNKILNQIEATYDAIIHNSQRDHV